MAKIEHVYLMFGSEVLEDYTGYTNFIPGGSQDKYPIIVNEAFRLEMVNHIDQWCDKSFTPKLGDEIHVVPVCILPIQDLRNNFKIKRAFDSATCNVFCNLPEKGGYRPYTYNHWMIDKKRKIVVFLHEVDRSIAIHDVYDRLDSLLPASIPTDDFERYSYSNIRMNYMKISDSYRKLLMHQNVTPCIYYEQLPLQRNELTSDLLYMIYKQGSDFNTSHEQYILPLSALAQANWKEYPYTMYILFEFILKYRGVHYYLKRWSSWPKQITELMQHDFKFKESDEISKKDLSLLREFSELLFHIQNTKFVSLEQLRDKLLAVGMPESAFLKVYNAMVKIDVRSEED